MITSLFILSVVCIACLTIMEVCNRICNCMEKIETYRVTNNILGNLTPDNAKQVTDMLKDLK